MDSFTSTEDGSGIICPDGKVVHASAETDLIEQISALELGRYFEITYDWEADEQIIHDIHQLQTAAARCASLDFQAYVRALKRAIEVKKLQDSSLDW